jgi:D-aminopeptidase
MLAYEAWIDATRDDPTSLYARLSARPRFRDGAEAAYGYGIAHAQVAGVPVTGHAGALRGFRAYRMHAAAERLSVVVIFNHEADFFGAAAGLLKAALGLADPAPAPMDPGWDGQWLCAETGLLARLDADATGATLRYATFADRLGAGPDGTLAGPGVTLAREGARLRMRRAGENLASALEPLAPGATADASEIAGRYACAELEAEMTVEARDGGVYARFDGMLGRGDMERVHPVGPDVWVIATRRSMDAPAPGDWTLRIERDAAGSVSGARLGCWLARGLSYTRQA